MRAEFHWRTRDGELRLIEWSTTALTGPDGEVTYMVGSGIDVTDARQLRSSARRPRRACATWPTTTR